MPAAQLRVLALLEGLPVTTTAQQYVEAAARRLLVQDVDWQFSALERGFWAAGVVTGQLLITCCMSSRDIEAAICGDCSDRNTLTGPQLRRTLRIVIDGGEVEADHPQEGGSGIGSSEQEVLACLWKVLDSWPSELVAGFLQFTTGTDRCVVDWLTVVVHFVGAIHLSPPPPLQAPSARHRGASHQLSIYLLRRCSGCVDTANAASGAHLHQLPGAA